MRKLFRENSVSAIESPERLDEYVSAVTGGNVILVCVLTMIFITVFIWAVFGNISRGIDVKGIVFTQKGSIEITSVCEGTLSDLFVKKGDYVETGDVIAFISQTELLKKIQEETDPEMRAFLREEYNAKTKIRASNSGIILETPDIGEYINTGDKLFSIMRKDIYSNDKQIIAYVPMKQAKLLSVGMEAQVSPDYAPREEYGYMYGHIESIGRYPLSNDEIEAKSEMVKFLDEIKNENIIEVRIILEYDNESQNSIRWSNKKGENLNIETGINCNILIVESNNRPIELLF